VFFAVQLGLLVGAAFFFWFYRNVGKSKVDLPDEKILSMVPSWLLIVLIVGLATISFLFEGFNLLSGGFVMLLGIIGLIWFRFIRKESTAKTFGLIKSLDWETILFLVGIFVVLGAITETGILDDFSRFLAGVVGSNVLLGFVLIVSISVILSGFIDNVPYIIVMLPVAAHLATNLGLPQELYMFGLLIGSCLGGNLTPFGASANVVAVGLLKKRGTVLKFREWTKVAVPFTILTTVASALFVWIVWR